jgi:hypothetical protein
MMRPDMLRGAVLWLAWPVNATLWVALCFGVSLVLAGILLGLAVSETPAPTCFEDEVLREVYSVGLRCVPRDDVYGPAGPIGPLRQ